MLGSRELREKMQVCMEQIDEFTTQELKNMLSANGCVYNRDYEVRAFSNAITYLTNKNYIIRTEQKGRYKVSEEKKKISTISEEKNKNEVINEAPSKGVQVCVEKEREVEKDTKRQKDIEEIMKKSIEEKNINNEEEKEEKKGILDVRRSILENLIRYREETERVLDQMRPSSYAKYKETYEDIVDLIDYLRKFTIRIDDRCMDERK